MKKLLICFLMLTSAYASAETINLNAGESIFMAGNVIKCNGGGGNNGGNSSYADLPWSKLQILLEAGLGPCKIEYVQGNPPQGFYSSIRFRKLHVNSQSYGHIREDIRNGNCD